MATTTQPIMKEARMSRSSLFNTSDFKHLSPSEQWHRVKELGYLYDSSKDVIIIRF